MQNYKINQIDEHTWQFEDLFYTYCYLIEGEQEAVLFDAGNGFRGLSELIPSLTTKKTTVILSHGHFDHTGCAGEFECCKIAEEDLHLMKSGFNVPERKAMLQTFESLFKTELPQEEKEYLLGVAVPENLENLKENEVIDLGGRSLCVVKTPGHTKGSICLLDKENHYLFSGDTVCNREILVYFADSASVETVMKTDEKLLAYRNDIKKIWPGHHECPLDVEIIEDYLIAAKHILNYPIIGEKIDLKQGYKQLYRYKTIGISYTQEHIYETR